MTEEKRKLNSRQRAFVERYLANGYNATEAALFVGYSPRSAASIGSENLQKPEIAELISARLSAAAMSADEAMARLAGHARGSMADFLSFEDVPAGKDGDGNVITRRVVRLDLDKAERAGVLHLIQHYRVTAEGVSIKLYDAQEALTTIIRTHGLLSGIDWTKIPEPIVKALAAGSLTVDDLRRLVS